ncbi:MAG: transposase [Candidatus Paracaedibacteraceae bacterium]|nr:transposase [Candidatus Paracaedibacteraceae bacterium]
MLEIFKYYPDIKRDTIFGVGRLWTQSYFVETMGNANTETIRAYVQNQLKVMDQLESASKQTNLF